MARSGVIGERTGEQVRLRIAFQEQRTTAILSLAYQTRLALGVVLDGKAGQ